MWMLIRNVDHAPSPVSIAVRQVTRRISVVNLLVPVLRSLMMLRSCNSVLSSARALQPRMSRIFRLSSSEGYALLEEQVLSIGVRGMY
jgi:hypothetical protein